MVQPEAAGADVLRDERGGVNHQWVSSGASQVCYCISMTLRQEIDELTAHLGYKLDAILTGRAPCEGQGLTEEERAELMDLVEDRNIPTRALETLLRKRGYSIGETSIGRYRKFLDVSK